MGSRKYGNVGGSQSVLIMKCSIISPAPPPQLAGEEPSQPPSLATGSNIIRSAILSVATLIQIGHTHSRVAQRANTNGQWLDRTDGWRLNGAVGWEGASDARDEACNRKQTRTTSRTPG
jgi:hypothetical protein